MLNELAKKIHENAKAKGFYEKDINVAEKLCLVHSEVSEALEADRKNHYTEHEEAWHLQEMANPQVGGYFHSDAEFLGLFAMSVKNTFEDELADVVIRVLDLCACKGIDIESHIKAKMRYNALREYKHGKEY